MLRYRRRCVRRYSYGVQKRDEGYAAVFSSTTGFGDTSYTQASIKPPQRKINISGPKRSSSVVSTIHSFAGKPRRRTRQTTVDTSVAGKTNRLTGQKSTLEYNGKNLGKNARLKHCKNESQRATVIWIWRAPLQPQTLSDKKRVPCRRCCARSQALQSKPRG